MVRKKKQPGGAGLPELTPLELDLMQIIWQRGNATAAEVGDELGSGRPLAATTIHTVLANLKRKGYIEPIPTIERALRFAPTVGREAVATRTLRHLMRDFFGGSARRLMAHLISEEKVDPSELDELRRMLRSPGARPPSKREEKQS